MGGTFHYWNPQTIHWGEGCVAQGLANALDEAGARKVFVVTTASVAANAALLGAVRDLLGERLVGTFAGIAQHAPAGAVAQAVTAANQSAADALVSLGGGSPIDAAKVIAWSLATGLDPADPATLAKSRPARLDPARVLPHFAIPTTLSVAELAPMAGFSTDSAREKVGVAAPELLPRAVFYDAELAVHTPLPLWLSTGIRAVDHAVETVLDPGEHPLPDAAALDGLRRLRAALLAAKADPHSTAARTDGQVGAWLSYLLPTVAARGLSHTLGKRLGSRHGIPHGVTSCLLLPHVLRFYAGRRPEALARIAQALDAREHSAQGAAEAMEQLLDGLSVPRQIRAYGLSDADLVEAARPLVKPALPEAELVGILRAAF